MILEFVMAGEASNGKGAAEDCDEAAGEHLDWWGTRASLEG
jgi:hypothetical protein